MGRKAALVVVAALALAAASACGGGDDGPKTFSDDAFGITFEYPGDFERANEITVSAQAGGSAKAREGVGLDEHNLLILTRFDLRIAVTEANLERVKEELDDVVSQAADRRVSGTRTEAGGLPGYEYAFPISEPVEGETRFVALFDGRTEYTLNCQSTDAKRAEIEAACDMALATLEKR